MLLTIQEIRSRLGDLMLPIVEMDVYKSKYHVVELSTAEKQVAAIGRYTNLSQAYLKAMSENINDFEFYQQFTSNVPNEVVFVSFLFYHRLTKTLMSKNQTAQIDVPDDDGKFFAFMFVDFFNSECNADA